MSSNDSGGDSTDEQVFKLTVAAFVISLAALFLSTLQALLAYLQFDNSEIGRRRCSEEVMGKEWAALTRRRYKWAEFRWQVFFEVPVFYTAPPQTFVGPLTRPKPETPWTARLKQVFRPVDEVAPSESMSLQKMVEQKKERQQKAMAAEVITLLPHVQPIYKVTGTKTSYEATLTSLSGFDESPWANVHTAEDEGCSWTLLLDALQAQERISREWDPNHGKNHTICYLLQRKTRCWDFMPLNANKPFATTTICHLVEMMAMLGLVWTEFDMLKPTLSAEGNGYMMKSEYVQGLGTLTRFTRLSNPSHKENRMIPCNELKRLCFGEVPSLFDNIGMQKLQVGPERLKGCLVHMLPQLEHEHFPRFLTPEVDGLAPIITPTFELIAMVADSVHIKGSLFRRLPNPCADAPPRGLNFALCLKAFSEQLKTQTSDEPLTGQLKSAFEDIKDGQTLKEMISAFMDATERLREENSEAVYAPDSNRDSLKETAQNQHRDAHLRLMDALHATSKSVDRRLKLDHSTELSSVVTWHFRSLFKWSEDFEQFMNAAGSREERMVEFYFVRLRPVIVKQNNHANEVGWEPVEPTEKQRNAIWLALMFKMFSWLFLHDFNPVDRMRERTEFQDSRLPIYIG